MSIVHVNGKSLLVKSKVLVITVAVSRLTSALKAYADHFKKRDAYYNEISVVDDAQNDAGKELNEMLQTQQSSCCVIPPSLSCRI